jgi:hypothetical protein
MSPFEQRGSIRETHPVVSHDPPLPEGSPITSSGSRWPTVVLNGIELCLDCGRFADAQWWVAEFLARIPDDHFSGDERSRAVSLRARLAPGLALEHEHGIGSQKTDHPFNKELDETARKRAEMEKR